TDSPALMYIPKIPDQALVFKWGGLSGSETSDPNVSGLLRPWAVEGLKRRDLESTNTTIGIVVGVFLALFLAAIIAFLYMYHKSITWRIKPRKRRHRKSTSSKSSSDSGASPPPPPPPPPNPDPSPPPPPPDA